MRKHTLVLAVASVALGTFAINDRVMAQGAGQAPVATPPLLSAPSNAPVVTPSVIPPSTPSTQPTATTRPALTEDDVRRNRGAIPAGSRLESDDVLDRHRDDMLSSPTTFPANALPATQPSGVSTIPSASALDRERDDMLLRRRSVDGTSDQAVPAGGTLNRERLPSNDDTLLNDRSTTDANRRGVDANSIRQNSRMEGTGSTPTTEGAPGVRRFVDPNRHDAFKPMTPRPAPNAPIAPKAPNTPSPTAGTTGGQPSGGAVR